jgi:pyruvate kinase
MGDPIDRQASTARALALVWGVSPQVAPNARDVEDLVEQARRAVAAHGIDASAGPIAIVAQAQPG